MIVLLITPKEIAMKKQGLRIFAIFLVLALALSTLTACGEKEEEKSTRRRRSENSEEKEDPTPTEEISAIPTDEITAAPTEEITQAPTEEPTAAPTEEPTPEPTEEPTPEPTEEPTPEPTEEITPEPVDVVLNFEKTELKCENESYSILVPEGAEISVYENKMYAWTEDWSIEAIYIDSLLGGALYDVEDLKALLAESDEYAYDLLYAKEYQKYGEPELVTINGTKCLFGPASDMILYNDENNIPIYNRYIAYDCEYDTGIILVDAVLYNATYTDLDANTLALEKELMSCLESVSQYAAPSGNPGQVYSIKLPGGAEFEFISVADAVNRVEDDESTNGVEVYYYEGTTESIYIGKYKKSDQFDSPEGYLEFKKKENPDPMFHFSEPEDTYGRMLYNHWDLTYHLAGDDYIERVYVAEKGDYLYIVFLYRYDYERSADESEGLLSDIIWSLREV